MKIKSAEFVLEDKEGRHTVYFEPLKDSPKGWKWYLEVSGVYSMAWSCNAVPNASNARRYIALAKKMENQESEQP